MKCSHVLIRVLDLHQAVRDYREAGFTVDYATDPAKAQHAHIWFAQGPIIELLTTPRHARCFKWMIDLIAGFGAGRRMIGWAEQGEGFCDLALTTGTADIGPERRRLAQIGIACGRAVRWVRTKPDGNRIRFQFAYPRRPDLPFIVGTYDPPQNPARTDHPNGASGINQIILGAPAADHGLIRQMAGENSALLLEIAPHYGVQSIIVSGLRGELPAHLLHGAVLTGAGMPGLQNPPLLGAGLA
jgi:hypothetical protein